MLSKKQKQILAFPYTDYDALICDGAIRSGKTSIMTIAFIDDAMRRYNNQRFGICGKTVGSAKKNIIEPYLNLSYSKKYNIKWRGSDNTLIVKQGNKTNVFEVFGGKDESSCTLIQGRTLAGILLDEVALMPRSFVEQALARCSVENSKLWFSCNPESPEHWFYKEWICNTEKHNAYRIHFLLDDNPSLSEKKKQQYESNYTGVFYQRFILGLWVVAEGLVYNFLEEYITDKTPKGAEYYVSIDYGMQNPFSAGLWAVTGAKATRIKEYYYCGRDSKVQKTDEDYCQDIIEFTKGYKITKVVVDPSATSFINALRRKHYRVVEADNSVLDGIRRVSNYLKSGNIKINRNCINIIKEFGLYSWDSKSTEDRVIKENDHCLDECRYFCNTILKNKVGNEARAGVKIGI